MRSYWPLQTGDTTSMADYLNNVAKYVVSGTLNEPGWEHTRVLVGSLVKAVRALKASPGADIVTTGSMTLTSELIAAGLVDEYRLIVIPSCLDAVADCSPTQPTSRVCTSKRSAHSARALFCCATGVRGRTDDPAEGKRHSSCGNENYVGRIRRLDPPPHPAWSRDGHKKSASRPRGGRRWPLAECWPEQSFRSTLFWWRCRRRPASTGSLTRPSATPSTRLSCWSPRTTASWRSARCESARSTGGC